MAGKPKAGVRSRGSGDNQIECDKRIFHARGKLDENNKVVNSMELMKDGAGKRRQGKVRGQREDFV